MRATPASRCSGLVIEYTINKWTAITARALLMSDKIVIGHEAGGLGPFVNPVNYTTLQGGTLCPPFTAATASVSACTAPANSCRCISTSARASRICA